jgi:long-subunit fatty acid transport protein
MKILLFFESNKFRQFISFSIKIAINSSYSWKNFSFWRKFPFSDEFSLLPVNKTIHSAFRGNLPLKTDKIVIKWRDFYHEVLLIPFEMQKFSNKF